LLEHLWKAFELYLNRKNKFIKAEERLKRQLAFFEEVKKLDDNRI
jgi:streptomycin 6-kinase